MSSRDSRAGSGISRCLRWLKYLHNKIFKRLNQIDFHSDMNKGKNQAATGLTKSRNAKIYLLFTTICDGWNEPFQGFIREFSQ
jgi:hypothetical protein